MTIWFLHQSTKSAGSHATSGRPLPDQAGATTCSTTPACWPTEPISQWSGSRDPRSASHPRSGGNSATSDDRANRHSTRKADVPVWASTSCRTERRRKTTCDAHRSACRSWTGTRVHHPRTSERVLAGEGVELGGCASSRSTAWCSTIRTNGASPSAEMGPRASICSSPKDDASDALAGRCAAPITHFAAETERTALTLTG